MNNKIAKMKAYKSYETIRILVKKSFNDNKHNVSCFYCDHVFSNDYEGYNFMTVDHKIPQSIISLSRIGGYGNIDMLNDPQNLVIACLICNSSKNNQDKIFEFTDGEIITNKKKLEEFKKKRRIAKVNYKEWARKSIFSAYNKDLDSEWLRESSYLTLIQAEMIKIKKSEDTVFDSFRKVSEGFNFSYKKRKDIFSFWLVNMGLYIRGRHFSNNKEYFLSRNYSIISGTKFFKIQSPPKMVESLVSELDCLLKDEKEGKCDFS